MKARARAIHLHIIKNRTTEAFKRKLKTGHNRYHRRYAAYVLRTWGECAYEEMLLERRPFYTEYDVG